MITPELINAFSAVFLVFAAAMLLVQLWLAQRQIRHVAAHRGMVPPAFRDRIPREAHEKAADYTLAKTRLGRLEAVVGVGVLLLLTLGGGLEWLDTLWRERGLDPLWTGVAFMLSVFVFTGIIDLPFELYQIFVIEERFGFNRITPKLYVSDLVKKLALALILGVPLLLAVLWLMQAMGDLWWLYVWLVWTGFTLVMVWAYPAFIAPLFNKFRPLDRASLAERLQALLQRTGFQSRGIFVIDGSRRSAHGNAYFAGLGRNKRIVFFDTLLDTLSESEIVAVLAHELGHFKLKHVVKRMLLIFTLSLAGLALLGYLMEQPWFYAGLGVSRPSTYAALTLFLLVGPVFTFLLQPLFARTSRRHEFEADRFAVDQADAQSLVNALVKLYEENASTLTPDPVHSAFYDSHPPAPVRISYLEART